MGIIFCTYICKYLVIPVCYVLADTVCMPPASLILILFSARDLRNSEYDKGHIEI